MQGREGHNKHTAHTVCVASQFCIVKTKNWLEPKQLRVVLCVALNEQQLSVCVCLVGADDD